MANRQDLDLLCYKKNGVALAYKKDGANLIYKIEPWGYVQISFAWGSNGKDLDICGYWVGDSDYKVGYNQGGSAGEHVSGAYVTNWSGDIRGVDDSEWIKVKMSPWSGTPQYKVHLNFFGYNAEDYPESQCTVIACQQGGETKILRNVPCSTGTGRSANTSDPGIVVTFDEGGKLQSLEAF